MYNLDHFGHYYLILVPLFHMIYMYLQKIFDVKITSHKKSWLWASAIPLLKSVKADFLP